MKIAVICTGDELLKGSTVNTNLAFMAKKLTACGMPPLFAVEVPDGESAILAALDKALQEADCVITSGGLGPTADDLTKEVIARHLGIGLEENGEVMVNILRFWKMRHKEEEIPPRAFNQALVPKGSEVLFNANGTAPGLILKTADGKHVILLPGPPGELEPMFEEQVMPRLEKQIRETDKVHTRLFRLAGIGETQVEDRTLGILNRHQPLTAAYCAEPGLVRLFLNSPDAYVLGEAASDVRSLFAGELLDPSSETIAQEVLRLIRAEKGTLATAESCTGGLVAKLLTDIPGASDVYLGSVVSYANRIKQELLGVREETLKTYGAVSPETAREMADGLVRRFGCDAAVSLTGVAGPDGGTPEKPVGLVYAGVYWRGSTEVHELRLRRSREQIRARAATTALNLLRLKIRTK